MSRGSECQPRLVRRTRPTSSLAGLLNPAFPSPVSDRLAELQRQRALAQEQLAWFDREIARESRQTGPAPVASTTALPSSPIISATVVEDSPNDAVVARVADDIIAQYQQVPANAAQDAKKGCYLWFAFLMMTVVLFGVGVYLIYRNR
jgi:hypothetical protein